MLWIRIMKTLMLFLVEGWTHKHELRLTEKEEYQLQRYNCLKAIPGMSAYAQITSEPSGFKFMTVIRYCRTYNTNELDFHLNMRETLIRKKHGDVKWSNDSILQVSGKSWFCANMIFSLFPSLSTYVFIFLKNNCSFP